MDRPAGNLFSTRSVVMATNGMAATSHPLATQIAIDILKRGGSAVDGAIAANAALGLMEPTGSGIGGDLFAIYWQAEEQVLVGLNASGKSPKSLSYEEMVSACPDGKIPAYGPLSVSTPGAVDGWFKLHERYGKITMTDLLAPSIAYAKNGFPVTEIIAATWASDAEKLKKYPGFAETFMPNGCAPIRGEIFKNPRLANTYSCIARDGRDGFYSGDIAQTIGDYMSLNDGFLSASDLEEHKSDWVDPVSTNYRGYDVWELPPNGQGIAVLQMLNILENFDLSSLGWGSREYLHLLIEAKKLAFEDRAHFYADPQFSTVPVAQLIGKSYAADRADLINVKKASVELSYGEPKMLNRGDTVYLTVADACGNMLSLIQSNYRGMGSGMTPGDLGFVLQDRGEMFNLNKGHANVYSPGKRPFHTIIPAFVTKAGQPFLSFGVMGAAMQPQGQVQIINNIIDFGMDIQAAGDAPRVRHDGSSDPMGERMNDGGTVYLETGHSDLILEELEAIGHSVARDSEGYGGYQAIQKHNESGVYLGASESRKDGHAAGY
tara:strand:+ start:1711 stop:3354 length:1644 start_codon:yes stop_codon:yes gene_type:complete